MDRTGKNTASIKNVMGTEYSEETAQLAYRENLQNKSVVVG